MAGGGSMNVYTCPSCGSAEMRVFHEARRVPAHSVLLLNTREEAIGYPKGDIVLGFCAVCGFVSNISFDPSLHEYSQKYEETQGFSPKFKAFHEKLATELIDRYDLHGKDIIEIGCGKGEFLNLLCELGNNRGVGFDPAYVTERNRSPARDRITFIQDFYSEKYTHHQGNFVCCKMTLEHIGPTADFMRTVRRSVGDRPDTVVFFQVPDLTRILRECAFWDIYYEHCSYFAAGPLARLFRRTGFRVLETWTAYNDQYLMIEARPANAVEPSADETGEDVRALWRQVDIFADHCSAKIGSWKKNLVGMKQRREKVVIWGGGSKGVTFLTTLGVTDEIAYAVDLNPHKRGTFMAGTGHEVVSPGFLRDYRPDVVIVMNPVYMDEVSRDLRDMGLDPQLIPVQ